MQKRKVDSNKASQHQVREGFKETNTNKIFVIEKRILQMHRTLLGGVQSSSNHSFSQYLFQVQYWDMGVEW